MGLLAGSDVLAGTGDSDHRDVVVMAAQEVLSARDDVAQHDRGAQRVHDVLIVRVKHEAFRDATYTAESQL